MIQYFTNIFLLSFKNKFITVLFTCHKIHPFWVYNSMILCKFIQVSKPHNSVLENFRYPQIFFWFPFADELCSFPKPTHLLFVSILLDFLKISYKCYHAIYYFESVFFHVSVISYKWNHTCGPLWWASFPYHNVFKGQAMF